MAFTWNEHDVCINPEEIEIEFPLSWKVEARLEIAETPSGQWSYGYRVQDLRGSFTGYCGLPSLNGHGTGFPDRSAAVQDGLEWLASTFDKRNQRAAERIRATARTISTAERTGAKPTTQMELFG